MGEGIVEYNILLHQKIRAVISGISPLLNHTSMVLFV